MAPVSPPLLIFLPQTNFIPCTPALACPTTTKLCYSICLNGGVAGSHTFLSAATCQNGDATTFCNKQVTDGKVASVEDTAKGNCVGLDYFNKYNLLANMASKPFQPRACNGRFPIFNWEMVKFIPATRVKFMESLATRLNKIWGLTTAQKPFKFYRPDKTQTPEFNVRLRRVQLQSGVVQVYVQVKEFCMVKLRKGTPDYTLKYNQDQYCDKVSVSPEAVFANLTWVLNSKRADRGMIIGDYQGGFNIKQANKPAFPDGACYTYQPDETPKVPGWVWALTAVGAMCCLLTTLILQHKYRNRASYVRLNEKLRSYV